MTKERGTRSLISERLRVLLLEELHSMDEEDSEDPCRDSADKDQKRLSALVEVVHCGVEYDGDEDQWDDDHQRLRAGECRERG